MDVIVIGAGPSGASAAFELAKRGLKVLIIEKEILPRYKTCGGGLVYRGRKMLPFSIDSIVEAEFQTVDTHFSEIDLHIQSKRQFPIITMVMRDTFDELLCQEATTLGVSLLQGEKVIGFNYDGDCTVHTQTQSFRAKYIIAADGALSPMAKLAGWTTDTRHLIPALEYEVKVREDDWQRLKDTVRFDIDAVPNGYAWSFPKKNHLSIGVASIKRDKIDLRSFYRNYLEMLDINEVIEEESHGFQIPVSYRTDGFVKNNVLLIGDAAGFADPITFEGISNAIYSGQLAAEAILESLEKNLPIAECYTQKLQEKLIPELKTAQFLAKLFYSRKRIRNYFVKRAGERYGDIMTGIFTGETIYPKDLVKLVKSKIRQKILG